MNRFAGWSHHWIFYLAASFYFGAVFLRSLLIYQDSPELGQVVALLFIWLFLSASEPAMSRRWSGYFPVYLVTQTVLIFFLLTLPGFPDFFATLLAILSIQVMLRLNARLGGVWIGLCALIMVLLFEKTYQSQAIALTLVYTVGNVFLGSYALATRRAQAARSQNQALVQQLQEANRQLQTYSTRLEGLAVARERTRLARDLHDSVTQTVFSMALTTHSAVLMLERDPSQVGALLNRLSQLAQSALSEMRLLISELHPVASEGGLVSALRQHLASCELLENLSVTLQVEGNSPLGPAEEQGLFRIIQEALNNVLKHAQTSQAHICLHMDEPFWIEVEDQGAGFDMQQALTSGGVGLSSMCERAAEIGWGLQFITSPGAGTRIRVEKMP